MGPFGGLYVDSLSFRVPKRAHNLDQPQLLVTPWPCPVQVAKAEEQWQEEKDKAEQTGVPFPNTYAHFP